MARLLKVDSSSLGRCSSIRINSRIITIRHLARLRRSRQAVALETQELGPIFSDAYTLG